MLLRQLASQLGCELLGDGEIEITGVAGMEHATPGQLTFLANLTYAPKLKHTRASAVLVSQPVLDAPIASLVSSNPYLDFARALAITAPKMPVLPPMAVYQPETHAVALPNPHPELRILADIADAATDTTRLLIAQSEAQQRLTASRSGASNVAAIPAARRSAVVPAPAARETAPGCSERARSAIGRRALRR